MPPVVPVAAIAPSNGMAVAALVLGILSFFCLGPLGGVLAVVFGVIGMNKAKEMAGTGHGMSIAGLILGIIGTILWMIVAIVFFVAADEASDSFSNWSGTVDSSKYEITIERCGLGSFDSPEMTVTLRNKSSDEKSYILNYEFRTSSGALIASGSSFPETFPANGSKAVEISSFGDSGPSNIRCEITSVENWFN